VFGDLSEGLHLFIWMNRAAAETKIRCDSCWN